MVNYSDMCLWVCVHVHMCMYLYTYLHINVLLVLICKGPTLSVGNLLFGEFLMTPSRSSCLEFFITEKHSLYVKKISALSHIFERTG